MNKKKTFKSVTTGFMAIAIFVMAFHSFSLEGKNKDFVRSLADEDTLQVMASQGLFASPAKRLHFAKATGWFDASLTDKENARRMANNDFLEYLLKSFNESLKEGLQIVNSGTWGNDYYEGEWVSSRGATFTVQNSTSLDVPGSAYSILYKEGYWGGGKMSKEVVKGEDVKAGQSVNLRTKELGSSTESENSLTLIVKGLEMKDFLAQYKPTGREYAEYVACHGQVKKGRESLYFTVEGLMGGCGTRLSLMGDEGSMLYNPKGSDMPMGGEQRDVKLISYDPATMRLVLQVSKFREQKTGVLDGTLKDGVYSGQFKNVNGKSSPFSFK